jgi:hypothetical protein
MRSIRIPGPKALAALSAPSQQTFYAGGEAVSYSRRHGVPIRQAIEDLNSEGVPATWYGVRRYHGHDLIRGPRGALYAASSDRSYHGDMKIVSTGGVVVRPVRGSRARTRVANHANAIQASLLGDSSALRSFRGQRVAGVELEADPDVIARLSASGELDPFDLYER